MERLTNRGTKEARPDVTISDAIKKLTEYEDLEEQGKLLKLPCAVGDKVYIPYSRPKYIKEIVVQDFMYDGCDVHIETDFVTLSLRDIGICAFLTQEQAAAALQALKETEGSNEKKCQYASDSPKYECQLRFCPEPEHGSHYSKEGLVNTVELAIDWGLPISYDTLCEYVKIVSERQQDQDGNNLGGDYGKRQNR